MDILKENKKYQFDFTEDIGLSETDLSTMAKASFLVQQLNGLLKLDGDAWIQAVNNLSADNSAFDKKYGQKFALLFTRFFLSPLSIFDSFLLQDLPLSCIMPRNHLALAVRVWRW